MSEFKVGDKVRALSTSGGKGFIKGEIYTVSRVGVRTVYVERDSYGSRTNGWQEAFFELVDDVVSTARALDEARKVVQTLEAKVEAEKAAELEAKQAALPRIPIRKYAMIRINDYLPIVLSPDNGYEGWVFVNGWGAKNKSDLFRTNKQVQELANLKGFVVMYEGEE